METTNELLGHTKLVSFHGRGIKASLGNTLASMRPSCATPQSYALRFHILQPPAIDRTIRLIFRPFKLQISKDHCISLFDALLPQCFVDACPKKQIWDLHKIIRCCLQKKWLYMLTASLDPSAFEKRLFNVRCTMWEALLRARQAMKHIWDLVMGWLQIWSIPESSSTFWKRSNDS